MHYGFDIGGSKIAFARFDSSLTLLEQQRFATPQDYPALLALLCRVVEEADRAQGVAGSVGIGVPGVLDSASGRLRAANVPAANGRPLQADLQHRLGRAVAIDNDANCFALSEVLDPANRDAASVLGLILGTGVGAGIVFHGRVHTGWNRMAGELGHMRLPLDALTAFPDLPLLDCGCGQRACIETCLSGRGFERLYRHRLQDSLSAPDIMQRYREGDADSVRFFDDFCELLACCVAGYLTLLDPALLVLGGGLSNVHELYPALQARLPRYLLPGSRLPRIEPARHGDAGGVRGAAFLALP